MSVARYLARARRTRAGDRQPRGAAGARRARRPRAPSAEVDARDARRALARRREPRVCSRRGCRVDIPLVAEARRRGLEVIGDVELFARAANAPVIAVTGSNGKSTVTTLAAEMLESARARRAGRRQLGPPALDILRDDADAYVLEISSFQMETTDSLRAFVRGAAERVARSPRPARNVRALRGAQGEAARRRPTTRFTTRTTPSSPRSARAIRTRHRCRWTRSLSRGYSIVERGGERWLARDGEPLMKRAALVLRGTHNESNALAALALTEKLNIDRAAALAVLRTFAGLPHRCQLVAERRGVSYIDDSKGTNVGATLAALQGFRGAARADRRRLGQGPGHGAARGRRARQAARRGADRRGGRRDRAVLAPACSLARAAKHGRSRREGGRARAARRHRLLSPACASQDMFSDYKERGDLFARAAAGAAGMSAAPSPARTLAFDPVLIACAVVALALLGAIMVGSASITIADRQTRRAARVSVSPSRRDRARRRRNGGRDVAADEVWYRLNWLLLVAALALLVVVLIPGVGHTVNGSRRWILVGPVTVQASEPARAVSLALHRELLGAPRGRARVEVQGLLKPLLVIGVRGAAALARAGLRRVGGARARRRSACCSSRARGCATSCSRRSSAASRSARSRSPRRIA